MRISNFMSFKGLSKKSRVPQVYNIVAGIQGLFNKFKKMVGEILFFFINLSNNDLLHQYTYVCIFSNPEILSQSCSSAVASGNFLMPLSALILTRI